MNILKILFFSAGIIANLNIMSQNLQNELLDTTVKRFFYDGYEYVERDLSSVLQKMSGKIDKKIHSDSAEYYWNYYLNRPHPSVSALKIFFKDASEEFGVPQYLLEVIAYTESNWTQIGPSIDRGWGIMHLTENNYSNTLTEAAMLLGIETNILKNDAKQNIRAAAALMSFYANVDKNNFIKPEDWFYVVKKFTGLINDELREKQAKTYFDNLKKGVISKTLWDEEIIIPAMNNINISSKLNNFNINKNNKTLDYPSAIAGFITCNFTSGRSHSIDTWVHHWIGTGTYAGALSWFNNSSAQASAHFVIRSSDGEITQCVEVANTAWHCGAAGYPNNSRSIGVEHEATIANPSLWNSAPMLQSSANMTCHFTNIYNIPSALHSSPGICGHNEMPGTNTVCPGSMPWNTWENIYNSCINISQCPQNLSVNFQNCSSNVEFSWTNSGTGWYIAVSTDPDFNQFYWKWVSGLTSYVAPTGFVDHIDGLSPLVLYKGITYYWKMWNGNSYTNIYSFTIPKCDDTAPQTIIYPFSQWQTQNFYLSFNDSDNTNGSGICEKFYLVSDFNGLNWSANYNEGFFYENFDNSLPSYWTTFSNAGNWLLNNSYIEQNDINTINSILSAPLNQTNLYSYIYNFKVNILSSGTSQSAGLHFFASDSTLSNRGNSYYVDFDAKNNNVKIYKSINNIMELKQICPANIETDKWYNFKVFFKASVGIIYVFIDNIFITAFTDSSPLTSGNYISLRNEACITRFDNIKVFKNRSSNELIKIGSGQQNSVRFQSMNSAYNACIFSIIIDNEQNISSTDSLQFKTDFTPPLIVNVNDGLNNDIDTSTIITQLSANWSNSSDINSGIKKYYVCAGSAPGNCDIATWTDYGLLNNAVFNNVNLYNGYIYYINVKAVNNAELFSISSSDGVLYFEPITNNYNKTNECKYKIFPNPVTDFVYFNICDNEKIISVKLFNTLGTYIVLNNIIEQGNNICKINLSKLGLNNGIYFIEYKSNFSINKFALILYIK